MVSQEHTFTHLHVVPYVHTWVEYGGRSGKGISLVVTGIEEMSSPVPNGQWRRFRSDIGDPDYYTSTRTSAQAMNKTAKAGTPMHNFE